MELTTEQQAIYDDIVTRQSLLGHFTMGIVTEWNHDNLPVTYKLDAHTGYACVVGTLLVDRSFDVYRGDHIQVGSLFGVEADLIRHMEHGYEGWPIEGMFPTYSVPDLYPTPERQNWHDFGRYLADTFCPIPEEYDDDE